MNKITAFLFLALASNFVSAKTTLLCKYLTENSNAHTQISFVLPDKVSFGMLVTVEIKQASGENPKLNTVVIKDYPYLLLTDIYRIENSNSNVTLIKVSPDKVDLEVAFVLMGKNASAKFYQGTCQHNIN